MEVESVRAMTALGTSLLEAGDTTSAEESFQESLRRGRDLDEKHTSRVALGGLAELMIETWQEAVAVVLLSFVDRLGWTLAVPVTERSQARRDARLKALRKRVGPDEFDRLWEIGQEMRIDRAVEIALGSPVG